MIIRTDYQNTDIITVAQCSVNTSKVVMRNKDSCNEDYDTIANRNEHTRRSEGDFMEPHVFEQGLRLNSDSYAKLL